MSNTTKANNSLATLAKVCSLICTGIIALATVSCGKKEKVTVTAPKAVEVTKLPEEVVETVFPCKVVKISPKGVVTLDGVFHKGSTCNATLRRLSETGEEWVFEPGKINIVADGPLKVGDNAILLMDREDHLLETGEVVRYIKKVRAKRYPTESTE